MQPFFQETADEGQPGENLLYPHLPGTSITAVNGPPSLSPPRTVQDLMGTVIEKQLMKSPGSVGSVCSGPPTITSILGSDSAYKRGSSDLATLSVSKWIIIYKTEMFDSTQSQQLASRFEKCLQFLIAYLLR